ncbi:hypothetical protein TIFTF001_013208 [Ficus carica]|uniref:Uncharacterized protein n=1 Tax=Ficus carica TaxID=3494 RepID=A0AA88A327_FICCA|nr:hypothetical protein TIFTF001_013208 [Ficus carica]
MTQIQRARKNNISTLPNNKLGGPTFDIDTELKRSQINKPGFFLSGQDIDLESSGGGGGGCDVVGLEQVSEVLEDFYGAKLGVGGDGERSGGGSGLVVVVAVAEDDGHHRGGRGGRALYGGGGGGGGRCRWRWARMMRSLKE